MSQTESVAAEPRELSPLQTFLIKVAAITGAVLIVLYSMAYYVESFVESQAEELQILKGGPLFWGTMEDKLYKLAEAPDLPPEKKQKIVKALRQLSEKYRPYFDAISSPSK